MVHKADIHTAPQTPIQQGKTVAALVLAIYLALLAQSCDTGFIPVDDRGGLQEIGVSGRVVDAVTGKGISRALVFIPYGGVPSTATDADGNYTFLRPRKGRFSISAFKSGYTFGVGSAKVSEFGAVTTAPALTKLEDLPEFVEYFVGRSSETEIAQAGKVGIRLPAADTGDYELSLAQLRADQIPASPYGLLSVGAALFQPRGLIFSQDAPAVISLPLGFPLLARSFVFVLAFSLETQQWEDENLLTVVDAEGETRLEIRHLGAFSVFTPGYVDRFEVGEKVLFVEESSQDSANVLVRRLPPLQVDFPEGLPPGVDPDWATSVIEEELGIGTGRSSEMVITYWGGMPVLYIAVTRFMGFNIEVELGTSPDAPYGTLPETIEFVATAVAPEVRLDPEDLEYSGPFY